MSSLDIESSRLAIDIHTQHARLEITNNLSRRMKIKVVRPRMVIERRAASFQVEKTGRTSLALNNSIQQKRLVQNKNIQRMNPARNGTVRSPLLEDASGKLQLQQPEYTLELSSQANGGLQTVQLPSEGSRQIVWDPGYVKVDWQDGGIQIEWDEHTKPDIQVSPYSVEIHVKGTNVVHIAVKEDKLPGAKGRRINKRV